MRSSKFENKVCVVEFLWEKEKKTKGNIQGRGKTTK